jgi:hypothetical protein
LWRQRGKRRGDDQARNQPIESGGAQQKKRGGTLHGGGRASRVATSARLCIIMASAKREPIRNGGGVQWHSPWSGGQGGSFSETDDIFVTGYSFSALKITINVWALFPYLPERLCLCSSLPQQRMPFAGTTFHCVPPLLKQHYLHPFRFALDVPLSRPCWTQPPGEVRVHGFLPRDSFYPRC